jgi:PAS domain-containing protein
MKRPKGTKKAAPMAPGRALPARQFAFVRAVLDTLPDHIYVKDLQGRYLLINEAGLRERKLARLEDIAGKTPTTWSRGRRPSA